MTGRHAVAADGSRIGFDVNGTGEPLVLLAGQTNSRRWWAPVRNDFVATYTTIAIDHLGTGTSDSPEHADWSTRRLARDVVAVLDAVGVDRAHIYGTSMGGRVAQWVAIDHPHRVGTLVLGCTSAGGAGAVLPALEVAQTLASPAGRSDALERLMVGPHWRWSHPGPLPVLGDDSMTETARRGHRRASAHHDAWNALHTIVAPTLVLHGTADELTPPDNASQLAKQIPDARLHLFTGARHAYFLELREEASAAVLRFLAEHPL